MGGVKIQYVCVYSAQRKETKAIVFRRTHEFPVSRILSTHRVHRHPNAAPPGGSHVPNALIPCFRFFLLFFLFLCRPFPTRRSQIRLDVRDVAVERIATPSSSSRRSTRSSRRRTRNLLRQRSNSRGRPGRPRSSLETSQSSNKFSFRLSRDAADLGSSSDALAPHCCSFLAEDHSSSAVLAGRRSTALVVDLAVGHSPSAGSCKATAVSVRSVTSMRGEAATHG